MDSPPDAILLLTMIACGVGYGVAVYCVSRSVLHARIDWLETQLHLLSAQRSQEIDDVGVAEITARPDHTALIERLRAVALSLGEQHPGGITTDDIYAVCPIPPGLEARGIAGQIWDKDAWVKAGWRTSKRQVNHGRPKQVWVLRRHASEHTAEDAA